MKTFIGVCLLLIILLYYWYFNVIDMNSLIEGFTNRYDRFEYNKPYLIVESNKLLCITLEDDEQTISMKPYPTVNPRQLWVPVKEGTTDIRSKPNDRICNKITQTKITFNPNEMFLKSYHRPDYFLHIDYNDETHTFDYKLLKKITTKKTRVVKNVESPIFTNLIEDKNKCAAKNYKCLTCTKCHQWSIDYTRSVKKRLRNPKVLFSKVFDRYISKNYPFEGPIRVPSIIDEGILPDYFLSIKIYPGTILRMYQLRNYLGYQLNYTVEPNEDVFDIKLDKHYLSFIIEDHPDNIKTEYSSKICTKCKTFTGKYNPYTCTDETNNLKSIRRFSFKNNELEVINRISMGGNKQYINVEDNRSNNMTISNNKHLFYFVPPNLRSQFYQNYLIRNNLIPRNKALIEYIKKDVEIYEASRR